MIFEIPFFVKSHFTAEYIIGAATKFKPFDKSKIPEIIKSFPDLASLVVFCIFPLVLGLIVLFTLNCCCCCSCGFRKRLGRQTPTCFSKVCYFATIVTSCLLLLQVAFIFVLGFAGTFAGLGNNVITNANAVVNQAYGSVDTALNGVLGEKKLFSDFMKTNSTALQTAIAIPKPFNDLQLTVNATLQALANQIGQVLNVTMNESQTVEFDAFIKQINNIKYLIGNTTPVLNTGGKNLPSGLPAIKIPDFSDITKLLHPFNAHNLLQFIEELQTATGNDFTSALPLPLSYFYSDKNDFVEVLKALGMESIIQYLEPKFVSDLTAPVYPKMVELRDQILPYLDILNEDFDSTLKQLLGLENCTQPLICNKFNITQQFESMKVPEFIIKQLKNPERFFLITILIVCAVFSIPILITFIVFIVRTCKKNPKATKTFTHNPFNACACGICQFFFTLIAFILVLLFTSVLSIMTLDISKSYDPLMELIPVKSKVIKLALPSNAFVKFTPNELNLDYSSLQSLDDSLKLQVLIEVKKDFSGIINIDFTHQLEITFGQLPILAVDSSTAQYSTIFKYNGKDINTYMTELFASIKTQFAVFEDFSFITPQVEKIIQEIRTQMGIEADGTFKAGSVLQQVQDTFNTGVSSIPDIISSGLAGYIPVKDDLTFKPTPDQVETLSLLFRATDPAFTLPSAVTPAQLISIYSGTIAAAAVLNGQNEAEIKANFANNDIFANLSKFAIELQNSNTIFGVTRAKLLTTLDQFKVPFGSATPDAKKQIADTFCASASASCVEDTYNNFNKAVSFNVMDTATLEFSQRFLNAAGAADYFYQFQVLQNQLTRVKTGSIDMAPVVSIGFSWMQQLLGTDLVSALQKVGLFSTTLGIVDSIVIALVNLLIGNEALVSPMLMYRVYYLISNAAGQLRAPFNVISVIALIGTFVAIAGSIFAACSRKNYAMDNEVRISGKRGSKQQNVEMSNQQFVLQQTIG